MSIVDLALFLGYCTVIAVCGALAILFWLQPESGER